MRDGWDLLWMSAVAAGLLVLLFGGGWWWLLLAAVGLVGRLVARWRAAWRLVDDAAASVRPESDRRGDT